MTRRSKSRLLPAFLGVLGLLSNEGAALANPVGAQVVSGQAGFATQGATLSITNSPGAILQWQGFSIGAGELTRFIQQSAASSVLNRVVGQDPSQILGALQSNGRVFLVNPNGILFGPGARVDVNGLVASTLNMSNDDFLAGRLNFSAGDKAGAITNQGAITTPGGGRVYLVAPSIENSGVITTPQGAVTLAAGRQVSLVDAAQPYVDVILSAPADRALNVGQVLAQGGSIGIYASLINQRGLVSADSMVVGERGRIVLKASQDALLEAGSRTSARSAGGGGEIRVEAKRTYLASDAEINADAIGTGNGGTVILWGDEQTLAYGSLSARGGEFSGNGGFIETSGKYLDMRGQVDTRAPQGATGTWLLDPTNIYIAASLANASAAGMAGADSTADSGAPNFVASGGAPDSLLTTGTLQSALASSSVVVSTTNASGNGAGFIQVVDPIAWTAPSSLQLNATTDILVNAAIASSAGSVNLIAQAGGIQGAGVITAPVLSASAAAGIGLHTQVGSLNASDSGSNSAINIANTGALTLQGVRQTGVAGSITIDNTGPMTVAFDTTVSTVGGSISLLAHSPLTVNGIVSSSNGGAITLQAGASGSSADKLTIGSAAGVSTSGSVTLKAGDAIVINGSVSGTVTQTPFLNGVVAVTISQCVLNPTLAGCSAILPALSQCVSTPTLAGCSVVLPTLSQCVSTPTLSGCGAVLPTVSGPSSSSPIAQAINSTINLINTTTVKVSAPTIAATDSADKSGDAKKDDKKDDKATTVLAKDTGAKKDEPVKKLYCN